MSWNLKSPPSGCSDIVCNILLECNGIVLTNVKGNLVEQKVDVIVNTTGTDLKLDNNGVSTAILGAAGQSIQQECDRKTPKEIKYGEVFETGGYNLSCKKVYHSALPRWGASNAICMLQNMMSNCLKLVHNDAHKSIAFPAPGTGGLGYPADQVAKAMIHEVQQFAKNNQGSSLAEIKFVLYNKDAKTIKGFEKEIQAILLSKNSTSRSPSTRGTGYWTKTDVNTLKTAEGINVTIVKGDITSEQVDVIANTTTKSLSITGGSGVSAAIATAAGAKEIESECKKQFPNGIDYAEICATSGGQLKCKFIYHSTVPDWSNSSALQKLKDLLQNLLNKAAKASLNSIAIPMIGTGGQSFPHDRVASTMIEEIKDFSKANNFSNLNDIRIIVFHTDQKAIQALDEQIKKVSGTSSGLLGAANALSSSTSSIKLSVGGSNPSLSSSMTPPGSPPSSPRPYHSSVSSKFDTFFRRTSTSGSSFRLSLHTRRRKPRDRYRTRAPSTTSASDTSVFVVKGDITKETTGAIVNSTTSTMSDASEAFKAIVKAGGETVDEAVKSLRKDGVDELAVTGAGDLQASHIFHLVVPSGEIDNYKWDRAISLCLSRAQTLGLDSISFPALGTGVMKHDPKGMAEVLLKSIFHYVNTFPASSIKTIRVVVFQEKLVKVYQQAKETAELRVVAKTTLSGDMSFSVPQHWTPIPHGEQYTRITLKPGDEYFDRVAKNFTRSIGNPKRTIQKIERIQNQRLYLAYLVEKNHMEGGHTTVKPHQRLWHGTESLVLDEINTTNFNRSYCGKNATAYGQGVYFAKNASYSDQDRYSKPDSTGYKYMYQALVLSGKYTKGDSSMKVPPIRDTSTKIKYDSVVDDVNNPTIFVVFYDAKVYPEYLITYK